MSTSVNITLNLEEAAHLWHTGAACEPFRAAEQAGRFETHFRALDGTLGVLEGADLLRLPEFDHGSLLWCASYGEALLLSKVHRAVGNGGELIWDLAHQEWVVLTAAPLS